MLMVKRHSVVCLSLSFLLLSLCELGYGKGSQEESSRRYIRSFKDALPKEDEFSQARLVTEMRHKIFNLESSMKAVNTEIEELTQKDADIQSTLSEQTALLKKLEGGFDGLKTILTSHATTLSDLESLTSPDENLFALSNQTCGGILTAQTGSIVFSSQPLRGARYPWSCIWTVRANNRAFVKVSSNLAPRSTYSFTSHPNAYVIEIVKNNNGTSNASSTSNSTDLFQMKMTRIQRNMHHIFSGPIIFIVCYLQTQNEDYSDIDLHLQYEGMGKLTQKDTFFSHVALLEDVGNFSNSQINSWKNDSDLLPDNANFTQDFTTIVISNFSTKVHLQALFPKGCGAGDSFLIVTDLLENSVATTDCCRQSCKGKNALINYDNPFVILITKKFQKELKFNLTWVAETPYPFSSGLVGLYGSHKCGEVLGGAGGSVSYKAHLSYRNGERCIWVIVPQPRPRSTISISVGANGVENTYDHLYMMELTNASGDPLADGPRVTRIGRYGTYVAYSRELYIVFYSDSSVTGYGFSLSWKSDGAIVKQSRDVTTKFTVIRDDNGSAKSLQLKAPLVNDVYQVFLLTPIIPFSYVFGMQLHINQTSPRPSAGTCLHKDITVLAAIDGVLNKTLVDCSEPSQGLIDHADGMGMIIIENRESDNSSSVEMDFSWREVYGGSENNNSYVIVEDNNCGGLIEGDKGLLKYKISTDYYNNERCVWLLHSPNSTQITLKLQKDGFESCCDYILVTTIDPTNGTLRNDTLILNRTNRTRTYQENLLVIAFRSDTSTRGRGFALQFTGNGVAPTTSKYRYQLRHRNEPYGNVAYPSSDWADPIPNVEDIFIIASSLKIGVEEESLIMPTNISWSSGVFKKHESDCTFDSISFYTTPEPDGWLARERYPNENDVASCPDTISVAKKDDICSTVYSAFLVVYKPLTREAEETETRMAFSYEKSAGCGGVTIAESGTISYKENGRYANEEKCVWLIQVPQANRIRFFLQRSGFEECCDILVINRFDSEEGAPVKAAVISQGNRTATIEGSIAIVIFTTDSSVVGEGFRLGFEAESEITEDIPYTYHLEHQNRPQQNGFVYVVEPNEFIIIAYSPELLRSSYTYTTELSLASFRPQIDEQCNSDTLTVYDIFGREKGLVSSKEYFATVDEHAIHTEINGTETVRNCTSFTDTKYTPCDRILDCGDAPLDNHIITNTTSFLVVYKTANVSSGNLRFRGFALTSTTSISTS